MRSASERVGLAATLAAAIVLVATAARADDDPEPSYGRIAGDLTLVVGAGGAFASSGPRIEGELRARYLDTCGLFGTYEDGAIVGSGAAPGRVLAIGLEFRPLFLFRWLKGHEVHRARFDLAIDSLALETGATFPLATGDGFAPPGLEVGLGLEVPIAEAATGPWIGLRGGIRWSEAALASGTTVTDSDRELYLAVTAAWHQVIAAHLVDVGDEAPR